MPETGGASGAPKKGLTLDDLIAAIDRHERNPSNIPKVDTFHFCGETVSEWLERVEQALVGWSDIVKFQRILQNVLHSYHQEVKKVIDAAQGSWERFKEGMQRKYRLGDGLLTTADLEAMNKEDFTTIGVFVQEFKKRARKVHGISEEAQCAIFLGLLTASKAVELTRHGGGNTKLTWTTIDRGVEVGCLDQVEQRQVRLQRQKKNERDATASGTPGVTRIVTDVLAQLGDATEPVVQRRVVTAVKVKGKESVIEEVVQEELWEEEEPVPQHLTKVQRKGSQRRYKTVDKKCSPVPVLVTEDEEAYYERERELIRRMRESALAGPCRINEGNEGELIIGEPDFLLPQERTLMVELMKRRHRAYAFSDEERGRLDVDKIPMILIHTVPHEPWNMRGARYPNPDEEKKVVDYLDGKISTHVADYSSGPYASPWFCFIKPNRTLRWVQDLQRLNVVTVRDGGGLSNADALSESCAERPIISLIDLYSGYDQFPVYRPDRPVTAMHTPRGLIHMNVAPQGWTNAVAMVQRAMIRVMQSVSPHITQPYIDDLAVKGPAVKESDEVSPGWMMELALANSHSLVEDMRTIEEGPDQVERHEDLMGGMYLLVNTLLQESLGQSRSLNPAGNVDEVPESQDNEFEEGKIKEVFRAEEYDGIYLELGLLLSCEMRLRDASDRAQRMLQRYLVRDDHLFVRREVGNPRRVACGRNRKIDVVTALHDGIAGGHRVVQATYAKISELYYWNGMMDMVGKFCRSCVPCQERSHLRLGEPLHPRLEREVGAVVHLDLLFMPLGDQGYNYIFDARDNLSGVERRQRSQRQRGPEPREARPSRGGRKTLARREEEPEQEPEVEERGAYPECRLGPVEFHRFTEGGLRRSPAHTKEEPPMSEGPLRELETHLDISRWRASPQGEEHGEQAEEVPREEVQGTQQERGLGDEGRRAGKKVIEVGKDTPPQTSAVGLRLGDAPGSTRQAKERLKREEVSFPSSEKAPSPEGRAERRRERAVVRREALTLIDRHLAAYALEHPDLEGPAPAEPRQESCQPEKEMEAEIPKKVDLRTRERAPAGETAEEKRARKTRRIDEIWQERQRLEAAGELPEQQQERQRSEAAGALPGQPPNVPTRAPEIPEMWRDFCERRGEELPSPVRVGFGVVRTAEERLDRKIKFPTKTTFDRHLLLESDLAGRKMKEASHGVRLEAMEVEIQELRALVASQTAIIGSLRQQTHGKVDRPESSRQGEVILEPEEARAQRQAEREAFEFRAPTGLATLPVAAAGSVVPLAVEEGLPPSSSELAQGSAEGSMGVLLEAVHTMQEEVSLFSPEQRIEEPLERKIGIEAEGVIESGLQRMGTPEYGPEEIEEQPMTVSEETLERRPQRLDTSEYVPVIEDLRSRLGSWATGSGSEGLVPGVEQQEVVSTATPRLKQQGVVSTLVGSPSSPPPRPKKKKFKRKVDQLCFYCKRGAHLALDCLEFLKDKAEGKVSEAGGKMYDRQGRIVEKSADGLRAQLYRQNQEELKR
ncbi:hypothetical protein CBR_g45684 [Chara braunii]|uniref:Uncharacterized protein n=1 Tax=Chara braunii TaxID=69332 RepID=A0A388K3J1_CHABU|nr:hypothetical protein CBR_g45684 [Chara braunii]|eukprot:GBG64628.1 hypothetical protein CBR_g45684 [Chara braunii]